MVFEYVLSVCCISVCIIVSFILSFMSPVITCILSIFYGWNVVVTTSVLVQLFHEACYLYFITVFQGCLSQVGDFIAV